MIRTIKRYARIATTYFFIALLSLLLSSIIQSAQFAQQAFRGFVSPNAIAIEVRESESTLEAFKKAVVNNTACSAIYKIYPYANAQALWYNESIEVRPPLLKGEFFTPEHLASETYYAVVGKNVYDDKAEMQGERAIVYFNKVQCTVIGVLGDQNKTSAYDDVFYINLGALCNNQEVLADGEYLIDYTTKSNDGYSKLHLDVLPMLSANTQMTQVSVNKYIPTVMDVLQDDFMIQLIFLSALMVLFASMGIMFEWIEMRKKEIAIRKLLGATTFDLMVYLYQRFIVVSVIALIAALPIYASINAYLLNWLGYSNAQMNIRYALIVYALCVCISLIAFIPVVMQTKNVILKAFER